MENYDVIVVGAGPAGLTAALYAGRARLKTLVLDKMGPGGQLLNTELIEDYTGFKSISGQDMARLFEEHALEFGATLGYGTVTRVWAEGDVRRVSTEEGDEYAAKAVIVCTGGQPTKLGVPGEQELAGRGVSYCAICDGAFFKEQVLAVIGGGDSAVEEATFLTRYASKLYLIHRRDELRAQKVLQERLFAQKNVEAVWNTVVDEIGGDGQVQWLKTRNTKDGSEGRLEVSGVFIYVGFTPSSDVFGDEIRKDEAGFIYTDEKMESSIPGIFIAGDVRHQFVRQITNAVGDATIAAIAATKYLEELEDRVRAAHAGSGSAA
ncbi:MAG: thioredoxin-disulfide reductase [Chloroflexota bacterium]